VTFAMKQALAALEFVSSKGYSRVGLVGSSFGGLVSILAAARAASSSLGPHRGTISQDTLTCLALKCPVVDFPEELNLELGREGMMEWKRTNTIPDILGGPDRIKLAYAFYEDCLRNVGYDAVAKILAPTIIVQGEADELIPLHQCRRSFDSLKASRSLCLLPGADHQFSKAEDFNQMVRLIGDWVSLYLSREGA
jgi:dienelactone hydrolase